MEPLRDPRLIEESVEQPSWRRFSRILILIGVGVLLFGLGGWQFQTIRGFLSTLLPYAPVVFPSMIALGTIIFKDWKNYKPHWVPWVLVLFILAAAVVGVSYQLAQMQQKAHDAQVSQQNIEGLKGQVTAAQRAQTENTKQFLESLRKLSDKISELEKKAATEELQRQLATVKGELEKTQKALDPPKAELKFSFLPFENPPSTSDKPAAASTETTLPVQADGSIHVPFTILNLTDATAQDGEVTLALCDLCKFTKEPSEFRKLEGDSERERFMAFQRILPKVAFHDLAADVTVPPNIDHFTIGIVYRCRTCVLNTKSLQGTVHVSRSH